MTTASEKLRALCVGHPHAKVAWPHRELHEAADVMDGLLEALRNQNEWARAALECKDWHWDGDQREAAEWSLEQARAAVAKAEGRSALHTHSNAVPGTHTRVK